MTRAAKSAQDLEPRGHSITSSARRAERWQSVAAAAALLTPPLHF